MPSWDTFSNFVNQEADYNFQAGLELLKRGGGAFLDATNPMSQEMAEPLNKDIERFAGWLDKTPIGTLGRAAAKGAQAMSESGADYGIPVGPMVGATWKSTNKFLDKLSKSHYKELSLLDKRGLEALTEAYPSVHRAELQYGLTDTYGDPVKSLSQHLSGSKPGVITLTDPRNYISHPLEKKLSSPAISYAHEGGHAFTGGSSNLAAWGRKHQYAGFPTVEGFAEGFSHALLGKYNKDVLAPYWMEYRNHTPLIKDLYTKSGYHGVDVANSLRSGNIPNQQDAIQELLNIIERFK